FPVRGLPADRVFSTSSPPQLAPAPPPTAAGPRPTVIRSTPCPARSIRSSIPSAVSVTHATPAPEAIPPGRPTPATTDVRPARLALITATVSGAAETGDACGPDPAQSNAAIRAKLPPTAAARR